MYRNSLFDNPIAILLLFIFVGLSNIILSVHFISIFLVGVVFVAFLRCVEKKYYYSMILVIFSFLLIENSQGLKLFSLVLLSLFLYIFILPKIQTILTSQSLYMFLLLLIFYIGIIILYLLVDSVNSQLISRVVINYFIDLFIISIII